MIWRTPKEKRETVFVLVPYLFVVAFGWWVPNDLLEKSPQLREYADFMASFIPQIDRATSLGGAAGQANRVIYACLWPLVILCTPLLIISRIKHVRRFGFDAKEKRLTRWEVILIAALCPIVAWDAFYLVWFDTSLRIVHFGLVNRFGSALMAPLLAFTPGIAIFTLFMLLWSLYTRRPVVESRNK